MQAATIYTRNKSSPCGLAIERDGSILFTDRSKCTVNRISPKGIVTEVVGKSESILSIRTSVENLNSPDGISVDSKGDIFVVDAGNVCIRKFCKDGSSSIFAGTFKHSGSEVGKPGQFNGILGLTIDRRDNLFLVDSNNNSIKKITPDGTVSSFIEGIKDPRGICVDDKENLYITCANCVIWKVTPDGKGSIVAGKGGESGLIDGSPLEARFNCLYGICIDKNQENIYLSDCFNHAIRRLTTPNYDVTTVFGSPSDNRLRNPDGLCFHDGNIYVADAQNESIKKLFYPRFSTSNYQHFPKKTKTQIFLLMMLSKHRESVIHTLPKDILYIIFDYLCLP